MLTDGPWDGRAFEIEYPPPDALLYAGEPYIWGDTADKEGRVIYLHQPAVPHENCRPLTADGERAD